MAYTIPTGSVVSTILSSRAFGQRVLLTHHYLYTGPTIPDGAFALSQLKLELDQVNGVAENYTFVIPEALGVIQWELQWIDPTRYRKAVFASAHTTGTNPATASLNMAAVLTLAGETANRRSIGNKHILCTEAVVFEGVVEGGHRAKIVDLGVAMMEELNIGGGVYTPIIYGRARDGYTKCGRDYPPLPRSTVRPVVATAQETARVMRRRTVGVGD